jgi:hypothetical protein
LAPATNAALNADDTEKESVALHVGTGNLPGGSARTPNCPSLTVGPVAGVLVIGNKNLPAFVAQAIGIPSFIVPTRATAVAGDLQLDPGRLLRGVPAQSRVNTLGCDGNNDPAPGTTSLPWNTVLLVPLCKSGLPTSGWIPIILPSWQ